MRILDEQIADLRSKFGGFFEGNRVGHGGANPDGAFIQMRQELPADEGNQQESCAENEQGTDDSDRRGMIEAPFESPGVSIANPLENAILLFLYAVLEPVGGEDGNDSEGEDERAEQARSPWCPPWDGRVFRRDP